MKCDIVTAGGGPVGYWLDIGCPEDYEKANEDVYRVMGQGLPKAQ